MSVASDPTPLFTTEGSYRCARWGRPIAPVVFGVDDDTLPHLKAAIAQTVGITGHHMAETDPELGANFMWFFCSDWTELKSIPNLDKLIPNFDQLLETLDAQNANQYRSFGFDKNGAIQIVVLLLKMDDTMADLSVQTIGTSETFQSLLTWSPNAFDAGPPVAIIRENGICVVRPDFAAVVRAAYDPTLPDVAQDPSHALRLSARAGKLIEELKHAPSA